jgi:hypothetical protein
MTSDSVGKMARSSLVKNKSTWQALKIYICGPKLFKNFSNSLLECPGLEIIILNNFAIFSSKVLVAIS